MVIEMYDLNCECHSVRAPAAVPSPGYVYAKQRLVLNLEQAPSCRRAVCSLPPTSGQFVPKNCATNGDAFRKPRTADSITCRVFACLFLRATAPPRACEPSFVTGGGKLINLSPVRESLPCLNPRILRWLSAPRSSTLTVLLHLTLLTKIPIIVLISSMIAV